MTAIYEECNKKMGRKIFLRVAFLKQIKSQFILSVNHIHNHAAGRVIFALIKSFYQNFKNQKGFF